VASFAKRSWVNMSDELCSLTPAKVRAIRRAYAKLPKVKAHWRNRTFDRVPFGYTKALAERFGLKNRKQLVNIATGKSGSWILPKRQAKAPNS